MKKLLTIIAAVFLFFDAYGQHQTANPQSVSTAEKANRYLLPIAKMSVKGSHPIGVSHHKTVHIVFPAEIKEVDAGIPEVITQITPSFTNVLKVKSISESPFQESNLTVLTAGGDLYSFIVNYQNEPEILNINVEKNYPLDRSTSHDFTTSTFSKSDFLLPSVGMSENQIRKNFAYILAQRNRIKNIGIKNLDVSAFVKNIYMDDALLYLSVTIKNRSGVSYPVDFIKLYLRDVETSKREAIQEEELSLILLEKFEPIGSGNEKSFVVALPRVTISSDKQIDCEVYEQKGGRHLRFPINSKIISNARTIDK